MRLPLLFAVVCCLLSVECALTQPIEKVVVGQVFSYELPKGALVSDAAEDSLPEWLKVNDGFLQGIPNKLDTGKHFIKISVNGRDSVLEIRVDEEEKNPCGNLDTFWLEFLSEEADRQILLKQALALVKASEEKPLSLDKIRVYEERYSSVARRLDVVSSSDISSLDKENFKYRIAIQAACYDEEVEGLEVAMDMIDQLLESDVDDLPETTVFEITRGRILSRRERAGGSDVFSAINTATDAPDTDFKEEKFETSTKHSVTTTSQRTTRKVDSPPVKLNPIRTMHCTRGVYCEMILSEDTIFDPEDGKMDKLTLIVKPIGGGHSFVKVDKLRLRTVPMQEGEFEMRLEARDASNQMASAPFRVNVAPSPASAHAFTFELDTPRLSAFQQNPDTLADFVGILAKAFDASVETVCVQNITTGGDNGHGQRRAVVHWSNTTLSSKKCPTVQIENIQEAMVTKKAHRPKLDFLKKLGPEFQVRKVGTILRGVCSGNVSEPISTAPTVESGKDAGFGWLALAAALALLLLLIALALICCLLRKPKKEKPSEFVSKGLPVVFPEEVVDDSETAHATTPMLVKEERPPLKVSQYKNPMYQPPPPIVSSPRGTTPGLAGTPAQQRLPPPYVPP